MPPDAPASRGRTGPPTARRRPSGSPEVGEPVHQAESAHGEARIAALVRVGATRRLACGPAAASTRPRAGFGDGSPVGITPERTTPHATGSLRNRWSTGCHLGALKATEGCLSLRMRHEPPECP